MIDVHEAWRRSTFGGFVALLIALAIGVTAARAEDPAIQRQMATTYGEKHGLTIDEAQARLDSQDRLVQVADKLRKALGESYAGIWFDNADNGRMKVGIAAGPSDADPTIVKNVRAILAAEDATDRADLVRVGATHAELAAAQAKINASLDDELRAGDVLTAIDPTTNLVTVEVASTVSAGARAVIEDVVRNASAHARVETTSETQGTFNTCVRRTTDNALFCNNPFRGGVNIGTSLGNCTAGFVTLGNSGGSPWLLTAGHCLRDGGAGTWASRDASLTLHNIGTRHSWTVGSSGDYGIIGFSTAYWNTSPYVVYDGASTWNETYHIFDAGSSYVGMPICGSGSYLLGNGHFTDCGSVTALDVTGSAGGTIVQHLGQANTCTAGGGNSGGPYYKDGHAYGLLSIAVSTCNILYQGAAGALNGSNVHLVG